MSSILHQSQIVIEQPCFIQLIGTKLKDFCIFSLPKSHVPTQGPIKFQQMYETFLLAKAQISSQVEPNIVFIRNKQKNLTKTLNNDNQSLYMKSQSYYGTFLRHVNLSYCRKLIQLLQMLNINHNHSLENQWLLLYQVHNYKPDLQASNFLSIDSPIYGQTVQINTLSRMNNGSRLDIQTKIGSFFQYHQENFYFLSDLKDKQNLENFNIIKGHKITSKAFGLTYKINEQVILCLPLHSIVYETASQIKISPDILPKLYQTCYVQILGNYCTGILINKNKVITTRHLLPEAFFKIDSQVFVRKFPYNKIQEGKVSKIGKDKIDLIEISLLNQAQQNKKEFNFNKNRQKTLIKQHLKHKYYGDHKQIYHFFEPQIQSQKVIQPSRNCCKKDNKSQQRETQIGGQVSSLGFGKFSYSSRIFGQLTLVFPTLATGIISKKISLKDKQIFLKTDCKLYPGFSGSAIWYRQQIVGMAVFILKNKNSSSKYNRLNFSYTRQFVYSLLRSKNPQIMSIFSKSIEEFDQIHTRKRMKLIEKLQPRL